jgi:hypothetical protein
MPWVMMVDSSATTGAPTRSASATSRVMVVDMSNIMQQSSAWHLSGDPARDRAAR